MLRRSLSALVAATAAGAVIVAGAPAASAATDTSSPAPSSAGLLALRPGELAAATHLDDYGVVVLGQPADWARIPALKAAHPGLKVFIYKDAMATSDDQVANGADTRPLTTGVGYVEASSNHPGWFATDTDGHRVPFDDYAGDWFMDVGSTGYQNAWAANVIADVHTFGADGVMMDDVNAGFGYHLPSGRTLARYPTDADWARAQESFLTGVVPQLHAAGVAALANIMEPWSTDWEPLWQRWTNAVDGVVFEYWTRFGQDGSLPRLGGGDWSWQLAKADDVTQAGKILFPVTYGSVSDDVAQTYARASFLLTWNGTNGAQTWTPTNVTDAWTPAATAAVGRPTGARTQVAAGVWRRTFSNGVVVVNSTGSATTVALGGDYVDGAGATVSSVRVGAKQGAVLTAAAPAQPTGTTPDPTSAPTTTPTTTPTTAPTTTDPGTTDTTGGTTTSGTTTTGTTTTGTGSSGTTTTGTTTTGTTTTGTTTTGTTTTITGTGSSGTASAGTLRRVPTSHVWHWQGELLHWRTLWTSRAVAHHRVHKAAGSSWPRHFAGAPTHRSGGRHLWPARSWTRLWPTRAWTRLRAIW